jgi:hypothetical protein
MVSRAHMFEFALSLISSMNLMCWQSLNLLNPSYPTKCAANHPTKCAANHPTKCAATPLPPMKFLPPEVRDRRSGRHSVLRQLCPPLRGSWALTCSEFPRAGPGDHTTHCISYPTTIRTLRAPPSAEPNRARWAAAGPSEEPLVDALLLGSCRPSWDYGPGAHESRAPALPQAARAGRARAPPTPPRRCPRRRTAARRPPSRRGTTTPPRAAAAGSVGNPGRRAGPRRASRRWPRRRRRPPPRAARMSAPPRSSPDPGLPLPARRAPPPPAAEAARIWPCCHLAVLAQPGAPNGSNLPLSSRGGIEYETKSPTGAVQLRPGTDSQPALGRPRGSAETGSLARLP